MHLNTLVQQKPAIGMRISGFRLSVVVPMGSRLPEASLNTLYLQKWRYMPAQLSSTERREQDKIEFILERSRISPLPTEASEKPATVTPTH